MWTRDDKKSLQQLIRSSRIGMLTTIDGNTGLRGRPMVAHMTSEGDALWLLTDAFAPKVREIEKDSRVNVTFASQAEQRYASLSGNAELIRDRTRVEKLWSQSDKAWFPKGRQSSSLATLRVQVRRAELWDVRSNKVVQLIGFARALASGKRYEPIDHKTVDFAAGP
jgi:general stress protein 26